MTSDSNEGRGLAERQLLLLRKCLPLQVRLHEVRRALGDTGGQTCLDIGTGNGMISYHLRQLGGRWHTVVAGADVAASVQAVVGEDVHFPNDRALPFKKGTFDAVVVVRRLAQFDSHEAFIEECHRILKPDGRLILTVPHVKPMTLIQPLRRMLRLDAASGGPYQEGFTESELFRLLKHGFDVHHMRTYSRFFVELTDTFVQYATSRRRDNLAPDERMLRACRTGGFFYQLASQLDMLFFFTRGHYLIAAAKRRAWRPREAPILVDGRSISEAVLSRAAN